MTNLQEFELKNNILRFLRDRNRAFQAWDIWNNIEKIDGLEVQDLNIALDELKDVGHVKVIKEQVANDFEGIYRNSFLITIDGKMFIDHVGYSLEWDRERIHRAKKPTHADTTESVAPNKTWSLVEKLSWISGIAGFLVVMVFLISDNTPFIGAKWWFELFGVKYPF